MQRWVGEMKRSEAKRIACTVRCGAVWNATARLEEREASSTYEVRTYVLATGWCDGGIGVFGVSRPFFFCFLFFIFLSFPFITNYPLR